ncbi:MAG: hypothetical protein U9N81_05245 [Bacillota bacterium]|nr:hypothetical protein [Bacillota bacterium]
MALCRCLINHGWPKGHKKDYVAYVRPIGYPETALICGRPECNRSGVIWLDEDEAQDYMEGQRVFQGPSHFTKMKANEDGLFY